MSLAPRVLIIMPDQWRRALLRAALREGGYDAIGARSLEDACRYRAIEPGRGAVLLLVVEQVAVAPAMDELRELLASHHAPPVVLIAHATLDLPVGPWSRIVRRPVSVADVVAAVESELALPGDARRPVDENSKGRSTAEPATADPPAVSSTVADLDRERPRCKSF